MVTSIKRQFPVFPELLVRNKGFMSLIYRARLCCCWACFLFFWVLFFSQSEKVGVVTAWCETFEMFPTKIPARAVGMSRVQMYGCRTTVTMIITIIFAHYWNFKSSNTMKNLFLHFIIFFILNSPKTALHLICTNIIKLLLDHIECKAFNESYIDIACVCVWVGFIWMVKRFALSVIKEQFNYICTNILHLG